MLGISYSDGGHGDDDALPGDSRSATEKIKYLSGIQPNPHSLKRTSSRENLTLVDEPVGSGDEDDAVFLTLP